MKFLKSTMLMFLLVAISFNCKNEKDSTDIVKNEEKSIAEENVKVIPIKHGTLILETETEVIYVDPTGGLEAFKNQKAPTIALITDIHGDHLNIETLEALKLMNVPVIAPKTVIDKIPSTVVKQPKILNNGEIIELNNVSIEAIPMYNLREEALKYHSKGRGNGYVLTINDERIYISGDTEDIPEMRNLKNIDKAFVCMNLPYTMPVESAVSAVLDFKPKNVYPYHYRGTEGLSDVNKFKGMVNENNKSINVILLDWY